MLIAGPLQLMGINDCTHTAVDHEAKYLAISKEDARLNGIQDRGNWPEYSLRYINELDKLRYAHTRNVELMQARWEYLFPMNPDDRCEPDRLAYQVEFLANHTNIALVGTWSKSEYGQGNICLACEVPSCNDKNPRYFFQTRCFAHSSVRFTDQNLLDIDGYKLEFFQDMETW